MKEQNKNTKSKMKKKIKYYHKEKPKKFFILDNNKIIKSKKSFKSNKRAKLAKTKSKKENKIFFIFCNAFSFVLFIFSYCFYYLSLDKCLDGEDVCSKKWDWILLNIKRLVISSVIIIFLIINYLLNHLQISFSAFNFNIYMLLLL